MCCVDELEVFDVEAERIRRAHSTVLEEGTPHEPGKCAFLDQSGGCRIYDDRPYVCRTQGLPLRWIDADDSGNAVELRDICPLNEIEQEPIESLRNVDCWTIGPIEQQLADLQAEFDPANPHRRVRLRDLFTASAQAKDG